MKSLEIKLIKEFLTPHKIAYFESTMESQSIAWEHFIKQYPDTSYTGFIRIYNSQLNNFLKLNRMCAVSNLKKGVHFSFKKNGNIFVSGDRFIRPGKSEYEMSLHYFGNVRGINFHGHLKYRLSKAQSRLVYLHDKNNNASAKIDEIKIIYK